MNLIFTIFRLRKGDKLASRLAKYIKEYGKGKGSVIVLKWIFTEGILGSGNRRAGSTLRWSWPGHNFIKHLIPTPRTY